MTASPPRSFSSPESPKALSERPPLTALYDPAAAVLTRPVAVAGSSSMSVETVRFDSARALVRAAGELDLATAAPLRAVLSGHIHAGRRFVRLDLSGVTFLDATALTAIVDTHHRLLAERGTLVITGVRGLAARVLHLTGLDEVLFVGGPRADDDIEPAP